MGFFEGVTFSLAGLVVLCLAVMRSDLGEVVLGRRVWAKVTAVAAFLFLGIAVYQREAFMEGVNVAATQATRELTEALGKAGILPTTTTTTGPSSPTP